MLSVSTAGVIKDVVSRSSGDSEEFKTWGGNDRGMRL